MVQQPSHANAHTRRRSRRQVGIYLDGTQLAEREPAKVFNDLAETPGVEIGIKHKTRDPMHLNSYKIDGKLLHTGAVNFSASCLKRQDNDWRTKLVFAQEHGAGLEGLVTSAAGLPSVTFSRTIRDDQN